jgi:uncharacterized protein (TIGR03435 family)
LRSLLAAALVALLAGAQAPLRFEVASVKPNPSIDATESVTIEPNGGIRMTGFRVINLILGAYDLRQVQLRDQIIGGPSWIYTERFDIVAKAEGKLTFSAQGRNPPEAVAMMKSLLEDRFAVRVHSEKRMMPAFAMTMARRDGKPGPKMSDTKAECPKYGTGDEAPSVTQTADRWCGFRHVLGRVEGRNVTTNEIASYFGAAAAVRRPIEDRTHLNGRYDFAVEYAEGPDADPGSFFTAFREQLGLKFDTVRTQVPVLVIDRVERPTPD